MIQTGHTTVSQARKRDQAIKLGSLLQQNETDKKADKNCKTRKCQKVRSYSQTRAVVL